MPVTQGQRASDDDLDASVMEPRETGDPNAAGLVAEAFAERESLVRLAYRCCWNRADAEDAVQNAFLTATARHAQVADAGRVSAWVRAIVIRQSLELARRRRRERRARAESHALRVGRSDAPPELAAELSEILRALISCLPERPRVALVLRHLECLSYEDVADVMGIAESTARVLVRNGRERLRELMLAAHPEWTGQE